MASFQQRGKSWQYTISRMVDGVPDPIRKSGFRTKTEARAAAKIIEADLLKGIAPILRSDPFDEYFEQWIEDYKVNIGDITMDRYYDTLNTIKENFKGKAIQDIKRREYQKFLNEYGKTRARTTSRTLNSHIRACLADAIEEEVIRVDFTRNVEITGKPPKKAEEKHLNYEESRMVLKELYKLINEGTAKLGHYMILLGLTTGFRFGELLGLTREDFNFKANQIDINKTWDYKKGKGFGPTKNDSSVRVIDVDKKTMGVFKRLFLMMPENPHGLIFYSSLSKYKVLTNKHLNTLLTNLLEDLDIERITMHGLRHTHISILLYKKVSIYYVAERAGHSTTETTIKDYAHVLKELREEDSAASVKTFEAMVS